MLRTEGKLARKGNVTVFLHNAEFLHPKDTGASNEECSIQHCPAVQSTWLTWQ